MPPSFLQKLFGAAGDAARKRDEAARDFVAKNTGWSAPPAAPAPRTAPASSADADRDGLQAAYLDQSDQMQYFLDLESGEVIDVLNGRDLAPPRFRRVPRHDAAAEREDQRVFVAKIEDAAVRERLMAALDTPEFRRLLSDDRALERRWYSFRNERGFEAVERWLREL